MKPIRSVDAKKMKRIAMSLIIVLLFWMLILCFGACEKKKIVTEKPVDPDLPSMENPIQQAKEVSDTLQKSFQERNEALKEITED